MDTKEIVSEIGKRFLCFVGGKDSSWGNPISAALKDTPLQFAAGVDVQDVVEFVKLKISESEIGNGYSGMIKNKYPTRLPRVCAWDFFLEGMLLSCLAIITKTKSSDDIEYDGELKEIWYDGANILPLLRSVGGLTAITNNLEENLEKIFNAN